jgi:hypothetical protein
VTGKSLTRKTLFVIAMRPLIDSDDIISLASPVPNIFVPLSEIPAQLEAD